MDETTWLSSSKSTVLNRIQSESSVSREDAASLTESVLKLDDCLKGPFKAYWETGLVPDDLSVNGFSVSSLQNDYGMNVIASFLTLDWLKKSPDHAKARLMRGVSGFQGQP